jgi:sulfur-carrier protein
MTVEPARIRVILPFQLRLLAQVDSEAMVELQEPYTQRQLFQALEAAYPMLKGLIIDYQTGRRRPMIRFFAGQTDLSHEEPDAPLPEQVIKGEWQFVVLGAIAGG